jgi:hypothetical protein
MWADVVTFVMISSTEPTGSRVVGNDFAKVSRVVQSFIVWVGAVSLVVSGEAKIARLICASGCHSELDVTAQKLCP